MKVKQLNVSLLFLLFLTKINAQPYVELANINFQTFSAPYQENHSLKNTTSISTFNFLLPKELKNGNSLLFRLNGETIHSVEKSEIRYSSNLSSISLSFGYQWFSKNKKWKTVVFGIPKVASDFKESISRSSWQYGGLLLENYQLNDKLQLKAGMYYNREVFGNFFVPLLGLDWKVTDRLTFYGIVPTNYKIEYNVVKNKLYTGLNFKSLTRSFQLSKSQNNDYVRFDEVVLKIFADYYVGKNVVFNGEIGYSIGKNPQQYQSNTSIATDINTIYTPLEKHPIFIIGLAYRIRHDIEPQKDPQ
jgi:hypothetical protein